MSNGVSAQIWVAPTGDADGACDPAGYTSQGTLPLTCTLALRGAFASTIVVRDPV